MSLNEYVTTRTIICQTNHKNPCTTCAPLLNIAKQIISSGHMQLSDAFKSAYPAQTYKTDIALARMLQMPVVCVKPRQCSTWFLCERVEGVDYVKFLSLTDALLNVEGGVANASPSISKSELNAVMTLAQSDQERQLIQYLVFKASGMTYTGARKRFGFQNIKGTERCVFNAIEGVRGICEAIFHIADSALLSSMGIEVPHDTESESESDSSSEVDTTDLPCEEELLKVLEATKYNWFEVLQHVESNSSACITENPHIIAFLGKMFNSIMSNV